MYVGSLHEVVLGEGVIDNIKAKMKQGAQKVANKAIGAALNAIPGVKHTCRAVQPNQIPERLHAKLGIKS